MSINATDSICPREREARAQVPYNYVASFSLHSILVVARFMKRHLLFLSIGHPRTMEGCAAEFFSHLVVAVEIGHGMSDVASA